MVLLIFLLWSQWNIMIVNDNMSPFSNVVNFFFYAFVITWILVCIFGANNGNKKK